MEYAVGAEVQEGEYGTGESIETVIVRNEVRVRAGRAFATASLPWQRIEAPGNVIGGGGLLGLPIIIDPTRPPARERREGLGDLRLGAGYVLPGVAGVELVVAGQVKLPTASARRGLGTGETDLAVEAEASRSFGAVTPFVGLSYTLPGDPAGYELRNSFAARGGVALRLSPDLRGSLSYSYAQSHSPLVPDQELVGTALDIGLTRRVSLGLYGNAGLSAGAPDVGAGVRLGWRIF